METFPALPWILLILEEDVLNFREPDRRSVGGPLALDHLTEGCFCHVISSETPQTCKRALARQKSPPKRAMRRSQTPSCRRRPIYFPSRSVTLSRWGERFPVSVYGEESAFTDLNPYSFQIGPGCIRCM